MSWWGSSSTSKPWVSFRLAGFSVGIAPSYFAAIPIALTSFDDVRVGGAWVAAAFVGLLVHELGHAWTARRFRAEASITLHLFGGHTRITSATLTDRQQMWVSLAGPAASFALGSLALVAQRVVGHDPFAFVQHLVWAGIGWGLLNLIPVLPQDGAQAIRQWRGRTKEPFSAGELLASLALVATLLSASVATNFLTTASTIMLAVAFGTFHGIELMNLVGGRLDKRHRDAFDELERLFEAKSYAMCAERGEELLPKLRSRIARWEALCWIARSHHGNKHFARAVDALDRLPSGSHAHLIVHVESLVELGRAHDAVTFLRALPPEQREGYGQRLLVWALIEAKRLDEALEVDLRSLDAEIASVSALVVGALFRVGRFRDAANFAQRGFALCRDGGVAYDAACSFARLGEVDRAVEWLGCAVDAGYSNREHLLADSDLESVRGRAEVREIIARMPVSASLQVTVGEGPAPAHAVAFARTS